MSKKSKLKRRKFNLLRHEFLQFVCSQCRLCNGKTNADFCYEGSYVHDPKLFVKKVLPELKEIKAALPIIDPRHQLVETDDEFEFTLESAFCANDACGQAGADGGANCLHKIGCLHALRAQIGGFNGKIISVGQHHGRKQQNAVKIKTRKQKKQKYVPPTPDFFCNDRFREEVDRIIGNNTGQQDKGKESARSSSATAGGQATDSES